MLSIRSWTGFQRRSAARRFLEFLSQEEIGPELAASIRRGISEANAKRGETVVCGSYHEMVEKLLGKE
jgi:hypothetical protein